MKCPACGKELNSLRTLSQHIAYIVQCCDMGFDMNPWDCEVHREWLKKNKLSSDYRTIKSFLERTSTRHSTNIRQERKNMVRKTWISNRRPNLTKGIVIYCILFFLLALMNSPLVLGESEEWLSIENDYFMVYYKSGLINDANLALKSVTLAREVVLNFTSHSYPHEVGVKVKVYVFDYESWKGSPFTTYVYVEKREVHILAPSENPYYPRSIDDIWYEKNIILEYTKIAVWSDRSEVYYDWPSWFTRGFAQYISIYHTTEEVLQVFTQDPKWNYWLKEVGKLVKESEGYLVFVTSDQYGGGTCILKYMIETYGRDKIVSILKSDETFLQTLEKELEVTYYEFEDNWLKWACEEFDADPNLYVAFTYEGKRIYEDVLASHNDLMTEYDSLNSSYYDLLADFDALSMNYISLNSSYSTLLSNYNSLQSSYNQLQRQYDSLNSSHTTLQDSYDKLKSDYNNLQSEKLTLETQVSTLQANVSSLQSEVDKLKLDYDSLEGDYESLKTVCDKSETDYNSLKTSYDELESRYQMNISELSTARNLMYIFMVTTIAFIAMTAYFAKRRTPKRQRKKESV